MESDNNTTAIIESPESGATVDQIANGGDLTKVDLPVNSFSGFLNARKEKTEDEPKASNKPEEKVPKDQPKEGEKAQETPAEKGTQTTTPQQPVIQGRDFSGIDESDKPLFTKMGNESFAKLKPIYLEHRKLKEENEQLRNAKPNESGLPESYYQHPDAYKLSPEYQVIANSASVANEIFRHWKMQEARVRRGEKWQPLSLNKDTGQLVIGAAKEATPEDEVAIAEEVAWAAEQMQSYRQKQEVFQKQFGSKYTEAETVIKNAEEQFFPKFGEKDHPTQSLQKQIIEAIPAQFRNSPLVSLLAKTGAQNALLNQHIKSLNAELEKLKGIKKDEQQAPPTKGEFNNGSTPAGVVNSFSAFKRVRDL